jgi:hypothetical protein
MPALLLVLVIMESFERSRALSLIYIVHIEHMVWRILLEGIVRLLIALNVLKGE